ncbi:MAG: sigma-70 family RNA polymerase sigma factor [Liquorilactobacillus nagelii]|uniref:RNA polymerase sigma factor n=1 Tax=Liquorilactobacillus nagelii TaxID=82688 RepID=UPI0039EB10DE
MDEIAFVKSNVQNQQLIKKIRKYNDSLAFKSLFQKYLPVVCNSITRYHFRFLEIEDLVQEARLVCYQDVLAYKLKSQVSFGKFFQRSLRNHYCSLLRKENASKRQQEKYAESFEEILENRGDYSVSLTSFSYYPLSILIAQEQLQEAIEYLSEMEFEIIYLLMVEHQTPERIAAELEKETIQIKRAISRCHKKISETIQKK